MKWDNAIPSLLDSIWEDPTMDNLIAAPAQLPPLQPTPAAGKACTTKATITAAGLRVPLFPYCMRVIASAKTCWERLCLFAAD
jgi:hypothetical protein